MVEIKCNTKKVMTILEQMAETKSWKASRGLAECSKCRPYDQQMKQWNIFWLNAKCWQIASI